MMVECKLFDRDNRTYIPNKAGPAKPLSQKLQAAGGLINAFEIAAGR
jgi:hypothetical protein